MLADSERKATRRKQAKKRDENLDRCVSEMVRRCFTECERHLQLVQLAKATRNYDLAFAVAEWSLHWSAVTALAVAARNGIELPIPLPPEDT
jgi:hypothetical protein